MTDITDPFTLEVFRFIRDFIAEHGYSPTLREIGEGCFSSHTTILSPLARLEAKGWIVRDFNVPRSIRLGELAPDDDAFLRMQANAADV